MVLILYLLALMTADSFKIILISIWYNIQVYFWWSWVALYYKLLHCNSSVAAQKVCQLSDTYTSQAISARYSIFCLNFFWLSCHSLTIQDIVVWEKPIQLAAASVILDLALLGVHSRAAFKVTQFFLFSSMKSQIAEFTGVSYQKILFITSAHAAWMRQSLS